MSASTAGSDTTPAAARSGPRFPDFLLVGAPKCGTSALHAALARHPQLFLSEPKEPKFFLTDGAPPTSGGGPGDVPTWGEHVWRRDDYEALFAGAPPEHGCESTVFTLRATPEPIRTLVPPVLVRYCATPSSGRTRLGAPAGAGPGPGWTRDALDREPDRIARLGALLSHAAWPLRELWSTVHTVPR